MTRETSPAIEWLTRQVGSSPPELVEMMLLGVRDASGNSIPEVLADGAMTLYAATVAGAGGREDAIGLLAADALFTYAFQAQAELDPARFPEYVAQWTDGARLAALLDGSSNPTR